MKGVIELPGFGEAVRRHTWRGERLPVPYLGQPVCERCGWGVMVVQPPVIQEALFFHGGYGEAVRETFSVCLACHRVSVVRRESVAPHHRVRLG